MRNIQLVTLRGNNVQSVDDGMEFDNDTLTLRYAFSGERGQIIVSIVNKLNRPL